MPDSCPSLELLCAFIDCNVTQEEQQLLEHHLVECDSCRAIVSRVIKSMREVPDPIFPPPDSKDTPQR